MHTKKNVAQAKFGKSNIIDFFFYAANKIYFLTLIDSIDSKKKYIKRYIERLLNRFVKNKNIEYSKVINYPYIFLPLQVSEDSQILLHSEFDNIDAIKKAYEEAEKLGMKLVIKPHPAERNLQHIKKIFDLKREYNFEITMIDTETLIKKSEKVITINSTVALESIILGQKVEILGRSFYKHLKCKEYLIKYITQYIVDIDYFSYDLIDCDVVKKCIDRAKLER
jgi:capsular polysaccharide export protein